MKFQEFVHGDQKPSGILHLTCSATGDWTNNEGKSVGTSATSGIYKMKSHETCISAISAAADAAAIIYLPSVVEAAGKHYFIIAPTGAAGGDISLYVEETGAELATNGDMDADGDHLILFSSGLAWYTRLDGVA